MNRLMTGPAVKSEAPADPVQAFHLDWPLAGVVVVQMIAGLLMILSTSSLAADANYGNSLHFAQRQVVGLLLGAFLGCFVLMLSWRHLQRMGVLMWGVAFLGVCAVQTPLGHSAKGAARWISLGPVNFQPSEFAKLALILVVARIIHFIPGGIEDVKTNLLSVAAVTGLLCLPILMQPDYGSTVILVILAGTLLFAAGLNGKYVGGIAVLCGVPLGWFAVSEPYRVARLTSFLDPFATAEGSGYQVVQGWIALAAGGMSGRGLAQGQAQSGFLPEPHTDFIAAVVAEEFGAIGWAVLVFSYVFFVIRGARIAYYARDVFGALVAIGITVLLGIQAMINLGVIVGWVPPKGLVLPFMSYGSSAGLVHTLCVFVLLRVSMEVKPVRTQ